MSFGGARFGNSRLGKKRLGSSAPQTVDELFDMPYWMRRYGGIYQGDGTDGSATGTISGVGTDNLVDEIGGDPQEVDIESSRTEIYTIELYDESNVKQAKLEQWFGGKMVLEFEGSSYLEFTVFVDNTNAEYLTIPYLVYVRDRWGFLVHIFEITSRKYIKEGDRKVYQVTAASLVGKLIREPVLYYSTGATPYTYKQLGYLPPSGNSADNWSRLNVPDEKTVRKIVEELLALQEGTYKIGLGRIDYQVANYELPFTIETTNLSNALLSLQELLPKDLRGIIYVDSNATLNWTLGNTAVDDEQDVIQAGVGRLQSIDYDVNWTDVVTRLYIYGQGADRNSRVKVTDYPVENEFEYLSASTVGTYGIRTLVKIDSRVKYARSLYRMGQRLLEEISVPVVTASIGVLDLAKADGDRFKAFDDFYLGKKYIIKDDDEGIEVTAVVEKITVDMANPLAIQVDLVNRKKDIATFFERLYHGLNPPIDLNDDGTNYPNIARLYRESGGVDSTDRHPALLYRDGDFRVTDAALQYNHGGEWHDVIPAEYNSGTGTYTITGTIVDEDGQEIDSGKAAIYKITGGATGSWTIQRERADATLHGDEHTGVEVMAGHHDAFAVGDRVLVAWQETSEEDSTFVPKIYNGYWVAAS
jgi:ribonuclease HII